MIEHHVRVHPSAARLPREEQLAWKLATVATGTQEAPALDPEAAATAVNRITDNASVAVTSLLRPHRRAFGARAVITLRDGSVVEDELAVADAHPAGAARFDRSGYTAKFRTLTEGVVGTAEADRFLETATRLADLDAAGLDGLFPAVDTAAVAAYDATLPKGLF